MSFQKDRRLSVSTKVPKNFARTPPPAFLFPDQRFQRPKPVKPAQPFSARLRRRRCLAPLIFRVNQFFLKNFLNTPKPKDPGGGGLLRKTNPLVNQAFQPFRKPENQGSQIHFAKPVSGPSAPPVSKRAADIRTQPRLHNPQMTNMRTISTNQSPRQDATPSAFAPRPATRMIGRTIQGGEILRHTSHSKDLTRTDRPETNTDAFFFHISFTAGCIAASRAA